MPTGEKFAIKILPNNKKSESHTARYEDQGCGCIPVTLGAHMCGVSFWDSASWRQEAQLLRKLDHPNIVKLLDIVETKTSIYLVMELYATCRGGVLVPTYPTLTQRQRVRMNAGELMASVRKRGRYKESEARQIVKLIIQAVGYLHQKGIVHRDLKVRHRFTCRGTLWGSV